MENICEYTHNFILKVQYINNNEIIELILLLIILLLLGIFLNIIYK